MSDILSSEQCEAILVFGRRLSMDAQEAANLTQRGVRSLAEFVASLGLRYVHMGTTVNWSEDDDDEIPLEGADAIVGRVVAQAEYEDGEGPIKVSREQLTGLSPIEPDVWAQLEARLGAPLEGPDQLFLAPAGWSVAELYDGASEYDADDECFGDDEPLLQSCSEDFPPGVDVVASDLPSSFWLRAFYA